MFELLWQLIKGMFAVFWFFLSSFLYVAGIIVGLYILIKIWHIFF